MGSPEGKILVIDTVSQYNRQNIILKFDIKFKKIIGLMSNPNGIIKTLDRIFEVESSKG